MVEQLTQHDPRRIGPFEVLGRLGAGGMGLVYLARSASGRRVAIKTVRSELAEDQLFRVRFTREVEAARGRCRSPGCGALVGDGVRPRALPGGDSQ